jgi:hypothetical protein
MTGNTFFDRKERKILIVSKVAQVQNCKLGNFLEKYLIPEPVFFLNYTSDSKKHTTLEQFAVFDDFLAIFWVNLQNNLWKMLNL